MKLKVKYFGILAEYTNCEADQIEFNKTTVSELIDDLCVLHPKLKAMDFQVAINNKITAKEAEVTEGEIAMLPPFSGG